MSSDDYQVEKILKYCRKSYTKGNRVLESEDSPRLPADHKLPEVFPRIERNERSDEPGCSCEGDPESDIADILHKKCPVITLAHQQIKQLLDQTDKLLCDNTRCCRSVYDFLCICKDIFVSQNKCQCVLAALVGVAFCAGLLVGAATCGSYLGRFDSPILTCIDNFFAPDNHANIKDTYVSIT